MLHPQILHPKPHHPKPLAADPKPRKDVNPVLDAEGAAEAQASKLKVCGGVPRAVDVTSG